MFKEEIKQPNIVIIYADDMGYELPDDAAEDSHDLLPLLRKESDQSGREKLVHRTWHKPWGIRHGE